MKCILVSLHEFSVSYACSLLDILADRRSSSMISGHVLVNGRNKPPNFKSMVGYVVQVIIMVFRRVGK